MLLNQLICIAHKCHHSFLAFIIPKNAPFFKGKVAALTTSETRLATALPCE